MKLTIPPTVAAVGRTILGKATCLMICSRATIDRIASLIPLLNHFQGRIAAKTKSG